MQKITGGGGGSLNYFDGVNEKIVDTICVELSDLWTDQWRNKTLKSRQI